MRIISPIPLIFSASNSPLIIVIFTFSSRLISPSATTLHVIKRLNWIGSSGFILFVGGYSSVVVSFQLNSSKKSSVFELPVHWYSCARVFNPKKIKMALNLTKHSYTIHLYNQIINRIGLPKNILPPRNSYLYNLMIKTCPEYKKLEALPEVTFLKLLNKKNGFKENLFDLVPSLVRAFKRI